MKKFILLLFYTLSSVCIFAQKSNEQGSYGLSIGYFGKSISEPGAQVGFEYIIANAKKFQIISSAGLHYYYQKDISSGVGLNVRFGQRYTTDYGLFLENYLGLGVQFTQFKSEEFDFTTSPATVRQANNPKTSALPNVAIGLGYDFTKKNNLPLKYYLRGGMYWLYPDQNLLFQTFPTIETGVIFYPRFGKR